jgi:hypothetical protein
MSGSYSVATGALFGTRANGFFLFALKLWRCEAFAENGEFQPVIQTVIAFYSSDTALFAVCKQEMVYGLNRGHGLHLHSFSSVLAVSATSQKILTSK